ncbi:MAG: lipopolysaccharide heptosyltransferase II [Candidatus Methylomirabilales bacterium]
MTAAGWESAERILCVRADGVGDLLMTTPAIRALRESGPGRRVTLLTSSWAAEAAWLVPEVDDVLVHDAPWVKATPPRSDSRAEHAMAALLRECRFDAAVIFTVYSQNPLPAAFLCYLADIPLRLAHCRENPYQLLTHWVAETEPGQGVRHEVQRQLDLVARVGCATRDVRLSLRVSPAARARVREMLGAAGVRLDEPWVVLHPGATAASRRYPPEGFAEAARRLADEDGLQIVLSGTQEEAELVARIQAAAGVPSRSLAGRLAFPELCALIAEAHLLIVNNTGPSHVAAAVGTPVVTLYALTNPQHTPWAVPSRVLFHDVPCRFCYKSVCPQGHHDCLRLVHPDAVVEAARALLGAARQARAAGVEALMGKAA